MANVAYLPIQVDRYGAAVRQIYIRGLDLTGVAMRAQVRLGGDVPGPPLADLLTVTNPNAEGLRLVEVTYDGGVPISHVQIIINETTIKAMPYSGEMGSETALAWDWQIILSARKQRIAKGEFVITGDGVTGADGAPSARPPGWSNSFSPSAGMRTGTTLTFGPETISVAIDGADLLGPLASKAQQALDKINDFTRGETGPANSTYTTIANIAAAPTTNRSAILAPSEGSGLTGATYTWKDGDYTGRNDVIASTWTNPDTGAVTPINQGAWVLPDANAILYQQNPGSEDIDASPIYPVNLALRETTSLERWYRPGDGNWYTASRKASVEAAATDIPIKMRNRDYTGARMEVHRTMSIEGNGARVDYAGVGNTPVAGTGSGSTAQWTPWPTSDTDAMADRYPVTMYAVLSINADQMLLNTTVGLSAGMYVVIVQDPAPNSSPFNGIPQNYDKIHIKAISGNNVQYQGRLRRSYNNTARVFACGGYAIGCTIRDLTLTTNYDAYQFAIRNAFDCVFENITGEGDAAMGAQTFSFDTTIRDMAVKGGYGSWSTARCCDRVTIDGFTWQPRVSAPTPEPYGLFIEESPGLVVVRRVSLLGGGILIGSIQNPLAQGKRKISIREFDVDVTTAPRTGHPLAIASVQGVSVDIDGGSFRGDVIQPDAGNFPNTPVCMIPISTNMAGDTVRIRNTDFISRNAGSSVELGGGFQGRALISTRSNTFAVCTKPKLIARDDRSMQGVATIAGGIADVPFASPLPADYAIALTPNAPVQTYYNNEGQTGFRINAPTAPDGTKVAWTVSEIPA